jgi:NAD(P)H dehydrogenase (quinone)
LSPNHARDSHPPRHVVILGHPAPDSFNHAIAARYRAAVRDAGQEVVVRDLYALEFDPRLRAANRPGLASNSLTGDVAAELGYLREAEAVVLVYPLWFGMPPAIIKGYVDRVLGAALTPADIVHDIDDAILRGKRFATFSTSGASRDWLEAKGQWQALRQAFDVYLLSIFGMQDGGHTHFDSIEHDLDPAEAERILQRVEEQARETCAALSSARPAAATSANDGTFD